MKDARPAVLAIAAHPDDIEFVMSGTMLRLAQAGYSLHYLNIANGCCGSTKHDAETTASVRRSEAIKSARLMGATFHESLTNDLEIFYDRDTLLRVASIVREVAPTIMLTHSPQDYMEDHINACRLAVTAAFARGMPNFTVDPPRPAIGQSVTVYHAQPHGNCDALGNPVHPDLFVDVGDLMVRKLELLGCHESQRSWLDESQAMDSYLETMKQLLHEIGKLSGTFEYAEGWRRHLHLGFCDPDAAPLEQAVADHLAYRS
ncbi:MAG: PIG-L family deacetylase [Pirellulaceae bacterium]|nr:PIG-L family deacetylase [Planctomycetales bacterium]